MPVYQLSIHDEEWFPPVSEFDHNQDIVAVGGDLSLKRLWAAYQRGIFPWFNPGEEIMWWCPQKRMALKPNEVHIGKSTRNLINQNRFELKINQNFEEVVKNCQKIKRPGQDGTWLSDDLKNAFVQFHNLGLAHSVEAYHNGELVGGLYGIAVGHVFTGESMFSKMSNASKICFIHLCQHLTKKQFALIDCQVYNEYLASLGAYEVEREEFLEIFEKGKLANPLFI